MRETWYILESGEVGDPLHIVADDNGKLHHSDGRAVAYAPHGPRSREVDADALRAESDAAGDAAKEKAKAAAAAHAEAAAKAKEEAAKLAATSAAPPPATGTAGDPPKTTREMTSEKPADKPRRGYKTRQSKGR